MTNHLTIISDLLANKKGARERARQYLIEAEGEVLTVQQAASMMGCSVGHVYNVIHKGRLHTVSEKGRKIKISPVAVQEYLKGVF